MPPLAGWWRRVLASLIDGLVRDVPMILLAVYVFFINGHFKFTPPAPGTSQISACSFHTNEMVCGNVFVAHANIMILVIGLIVITLGWGAYVVFAIAGKHGATIGMRAMKIRIVSARDLGPVSKGRSLIRYAVYLAIRLVAFKIDGLPTAADSLWPLWDKRNQTLHDKVAGTVAIDLR
jgi:uncharacterized RDD family membrane protein YckC